jgi:hypothetical protein
MTVLRSSTIGSSGTARPRISDVSKLAFDNARVGRGRLSPPRIVIHPPMTKTKALFLCLALAGAALIASGPGSSPAFGDSGDGVLHPGDLVEDGDLSMAVPPPGEEVWGEILRDDGHEQVLGIETLPDGTVAVYRSAPELHGGGADVNGAEGDGSDGESQTDGACQDDAYSLSGPKWTKRYEWYFKANSTPSGISQDDAETALRSAADNITHAHNDCGLADTISATVAYQGTTGKSTGIGSNGSCSGKDGTNVVAFGDLPSGYLGLTCWWSKSGSITEADMMLNKVDYDWYINKPNNCSGEWGVQDVATHEFGHVFGLSHVSESLHPALTMSPVIGSCQGAEKSLGLGDVDGLEALY